jgi:hypothetical protein
MWFLFNVVPFGFSGAISGGPIMSVLMLERVALRRIFVGGSIGFGLGIARPIWFGLIWADAYAEIHDGLILVPVLVNALPGGVLAAMSGAAIGAVSHIKPFPSKAAIYGAIATGILGAPFGQTTRELSDLLFHGLFWASFGMPFWTVVLQPVLARQWALKGANIGAIALPIITGPLFVLYLIPLMTWTTFSIIDVAALLMLSVAGALLGSLIGGAVGWVVATV